MLLFVTTPASAQGAGGWACGAYDQTAKRGKAPTPGADDHVYPIVTIHGITGSDQDFDRTIDLSYIDAHPKPPRSMLDLFAGSKQPDQKLPPGLDGVAVYSFSYTPDSLRWVDDSRVGGKFAETIDCLYDKWKVPVSVVAHSMGGLVTRWVANSTDSKGVPRSKKLGKVITLGTPYEGSDMAAWVNGITDSLGPAEYLLGYICGYTGTETGRGSCGPLPLLSALKSEAGRALSAGSAELSALSSWPKDLDVRTIAGSIRLPLNLLGSPLNGSTDVGDLIVPTKSATSDPRPGRVFECRYDTATGAAATQLKKIVGLANPQDRQAQLGRLIGGGPCFHSNLMRNVELSNDVIGELNDWLVARRSSQADAERDPAARLVRCSEPDGFGGCFFDSPSHNIGCHIGLGGARCDILVKSWHVPRPGDCPREWAFGYGMEVGTVGRATYVCATDTVGPGGQAILGYGLGLKIGNFECLSTAGSGVHCENTRTGHGFVISRRIHKVF
ncbi:MAG: hypothetical protein WEB06_13275 [Actinomycetota bacterium]